MRYENDYIQRELNAFAKMQIKVGIMGNEDSELLKNAYIHEFGFTKTPKSAKNLAIPLKPSVRGKSPREIENTFILEGKDEFEFLFMLMPSVTIPERLFIRAGYDNNNDRITKTLDNAITKIIKGDADAMQAAHYVGIAKGYYLATVRPCAATQEQCNISVCSGQNQTANRRGTPSGGNSV